MSLVASGPLRRAMATAVRDPRRPVESTLRAKIQQALAPAHLEVLNESHRHAVPPGSETHFKVVVVSPRFEGLPLLQRHRLVHAAVGQELAGPVHALSIHARTPQQWADDARIDTSPPCLGGSKHESGRVGQGDPTPHHPVTEHSVNK
ncbi:bolA-like protein 1 [Mobula birostris]|uniref:bolA-like protein 1 n=1 Tax=Mobula birostris TaxID=1983395 RepID=UPI003B283972